MWVMEAPAPQIDILFICCCFVDCCNVQQPRFSFYPQIKRSVRSNQSYGYFVMNNVMRKKTNTQTDVANLYIYNFRYTIISHRITLFFDNSITRRLELQWHFRKASYNFQNRIACLRNRYLLNTSEQEQVVHI